MQINMSPNFLNQKVLEQKVKNNSSSIKIIASELNLNLIERKAKELYDLI